MCGRSLTGAVVKRGYGREAVYKCPSKYQGGCGGTQRIARKLDALIEDLLFAHIEANARANGQIAAVPDADDPDAMELADVQKRLFSLRTGYAQGTVSDDSMFNVVPELEARERRLKSELAKTAKTRMSRMSRAKSPADVRREWDEAAGNVGVRRAILSRYLKGVVVRRSGRHGPGNSIMPLSSPSGGKTATRRLTITWLDCQASKCPAAKYPSGRAPGSQLAFSASCSS